VRLRRKKNPVDQPSVDRYAITQERIECLAEMLYRPTRYTQRFVEQVAFISSGGQRWTRTLQIRIPEAAAPSGRSWRLVSLGQYARRRFPDFVVTDASGARVSLLTRRQHGYSLTRVILAKSIYNLPADHNHLWSQDRVNRAYRDLRETLYEFFTTAGSIDNPDEDLTEYKLLLENLGLSPRFIEDHLLNSFARKFPLVEKYAELLESIGVMGDTMAERIEAFADACAMTVDATRYLCWVDAEPGDILNLQVSYSVKDSNHEIEYESVPEQLATYWYGLAEPRDRRKSVWANWYRQVGLTPINYAFSIPGYRHTGSYYFTLEPPPTTDVTYLDWGVGNSRENTEIDCALDSAHIHTGDESSLPAAVSGGTIRAYLRCRPHHHKQIVGSAILNGLFVYLVGQGRLPGKLGESAQSLLLVVPSILIAYLVRQQRHYYAHVLRQQRAILWGYLATSILFLIAVIFSRYEPTLGSRGLGLVATLTAWLLALSSAAVFAWYLPLGYSYERITRYLMDKKRKKAQRRAEKMVDKPKGEWLAIRNRKGEDDDPLTQKWQYYQDAVHQYCNWICCFVVISVFCMGIFMYKTWDFYPRRDPVKHKIITQIFQALGLLTVTNWPSASCKRCNFNFRFVPSADPISR
jgi:hypothetical protein